jgi:hypothetical protein
MCSRIAGGYVDRSPRRSRDGLEPGGPPDFEWTATRPGLRPGRSSRQPLLQDRSDDHVASREMTRITTSSRGAVTRRGSSPFPVYRQISNAVGGEGRKPRVCGPEAQTPPDQPDEPAPADRAAINFAFGWLDIPTSPRARASFRSCATVQVWSGTVKPWSAVSPAPAEAVVFAGSLAWPGCAAAAARSSFLRSFPTSALEREAARRCSEAAFFHRSAFAFALVSLVFVPPIGPAPRTRSASVLRWLRSAS